MDLNWRDGETWRVLCGDAWEVLRSLPEASVQACVTSPPYWSQRVYAVPPVTWDADVFCDHEWDAETSRCRRCSAWRGQLGMERTPDLYVSHLVSIFREVRRVLRPDGTLWTVIGDCWYSGDRGGYRKASHRWDSSPLQPRQKGSHLEEPAPNRLPQAGLKDKDLAMIPARVALALQADGWWLRDEIVWAKKAPMPYPALDRTVRSHEMVYLLARSASYYFDWRAIADPAKHAGKRVKLGVKSLSIAQADGADLPRSGNARKDSVVVAALRRSRSVWLLGPEPSKEEHFATFPRELARRCILASTRPGDVVLDPFAGTGRAGLAALEAGRRFVGIELSPKYAAIARSALGGSV